MGYTGPQWQSGRMTFDTGPGATTTTLTPGLPVDLSCRDQMRVRITVTKAVTDAADTLNGVVQFTDDGTFWDTVGAFPELTGDMDASASAPLVRELVITAREHLDAPEESSTPTSSNDAASFPKGAVKNRPMPGRAFSEGQWIDTLRVVLTTQDVDGDGDMEGWVEIFAP